MLLFPLAFHQLCDRSRANHVCRDFNVDGTLFHLEASWRNVDCSSNRKTCRGWWFPENYGCCLIDFEYGVHAILLNRSSNQSHDFTCNLRGHQRQHFSCVGWKQKPMGQFLSYNSVLKCCQVGSFGKPRILDHLLLRGRQLWKYWQRWRREKLASLYLLDHLWYNTFNSNYSRYRGLQIRKYHLFIFWPTYNFCSFFADKKHQ